MNSQLVVDHGQRVMAHLAGADRVEDGAEALPNPLFDLRLAADLYAGHQFAFEVTAECGGSREAAQQAHAFHQLAQVFRVAEEVGFDQRLVARVRRVEADLSATLWLHHRHMQADAVAEGDQPLGLVLQRGRDYQAEFGGRGVRVQAQEAAGFHCVRGQRAAPAEQVLPGRAGKWPQALGGKAETQLGFAAVHQHDVLVILQVLADAGQLVVQRDAVAGEFGSRANAGQHQQLRRVDGAGAEDHLTLGMQA
ncbi:hypothetical protein FQZ97_823940 [compost metagenome]